MGKLIIDLSILYNGTAGAEPPTVTLVNIDISKINDETLPKDRLKYQKQKLSPGMAEFSDWLAMRRHAPILKA
jgi:hypothetical protein